MGLEDLCALVRAVHNVRLPSAVHSSSLLHSYLLLRKRSTQH
jgi:hypothetical protein